MTKALLLQKAPYTASASRDSYFDNLKAILIFLVVLGHIIAPLIKSENNNIIRSTYLFIYTFHMPCFIFVSGYFSKKGLTILDLFTKFLVPLIIFQVFYTAFEFNLNPRSFKLHKFLLVPFHALWYLASLCFWHLILNLIPYKNIKHAIILSFLLSLVIGVSGRFGLQLSLSRTFYFLPFFLLGFYLRQNGWSSILKGTNSQKVLFALLMLAVFSALILYPYAVSEKMLYGNTAYKNMRIEKPEGLLIRTGVLLCNLLVGLAFFKLVPQTPTFFTKYGGRTLQIYLLHDIIARPLLYYKPWQNLGGQALLIVFSIAVTIITYQLTSLPLFGRWLSLISSKSKTFLVSLTKRQKSPSKHQPIA